MAGQVWKKDYEFTVCYFLMEAMNEGTLCDNKQIKVKNLRESWSQWQRFTKVKVNAMTFPKQRMWLDQVLVEYLYRGKKEELNKRKVKKQC